MPTRPLAMAEHGEPLLRAAKTHGTTFDAATSRAAGVSPSAFRHRVQGLGLRAALDAIYTENGGAFGETNVRRDADKSRHASGQGMQESPGAGKSGGSREGQRVTRTSTASGDTLESKGEKIRTLEQLLEYAEVDLSVWRVKDYTVNSWEMNAGGGEVVMLFQVKARLERVRAAADLFALRDAVVDAMRGHEVAPVRRYKVKPRSGLMFEFLCPDLHLGALAHAEETGDNYDTKIAVAAFRRVLYGLLTHAQDMRVGRIVFPVGNDILHVDSAADTTTAGTPQDTDGRHYRSRRRAVELLVEAVDAMAQIAPVEIPVVPGNHAREQESMLGEVLRAWYRNEPRVTLLDSPAPRKYVEHGSVMVGYTHGDGVKAQDLPLVMAAEAPGMWARTRHRSWSLGHLHQRRSDTFGMVREYKGVEVRVSPSLKATDSWHSGRAYIANLRAAEAHVYSDTDGEIARFRAVLPEGFGNEKRAA